VYVEAIEKNAARMKNVFFDTSGVSGLGDWNANKAAQVANRIRQLGLKRLLYGSDSPIPMNFPRDAYKRWRQIPLKEEEFRIIESNVSPYFRERSGSGR
jgi:predicted TIM-barrel fold metal-dependent hydrolase